MGCYKLILTKSAKKHLAKLPKAKSRRQIFADLDELGGGNWHLLDCQKLTGYKNLYRLRCGDYRVIFEFQKAVATVKIIAVGHRKYI